MPSEPDLGSLPALPIDNEGPVFKAPWEAQVFAMALKLHEAGYFTWAEWTESLGKAIKADQTRGDPDLGDTYYEHWLACLEAIIAEKGLLTPAMLDQRKEAIRHEQERIHRLDHPREPRSDRIGFQGHHT